MSFTVGNLYTHPMMTDVAFSPTNIQGEELVVAWFLKRSRKLMVEGDVITIPKTRIEEFYEI